VGKGRKAIPARPVRREKRAISDPLVRQAHSVLRVQQDLLARPVGREKRAMSDPLVRQAHPVLRAQQDLLARPVLPVLPAKVRFGLFVPIVTRRPAARNVIKTKCS
jgi:hypothetical protein